MANEAFVDLTDEQRSALLQRFAAMENIYKARLDVNAANQEVIKSKLPLSREAISRFSL